MTNKVKGCLPQPLLAALGPEAVPMHLLLGMWWNWSGREGTTGGLLQKWRPAGEPSTPLVTPRIIWSSACICGTSS